WFSTQSSEMQAANRLQKALRTGSGLTFGAWQMLPGSNQARTIARCGFDWVTVDTEHGNIDGEDVERSKEGSRESKAEYSADGLTDRCGDARGGSGNCWMRSNEGWMVKRALDSGAHGIVVPLLYTADDARRLVKSAKFPPQGQRGFGSPFAMERVGGVTMTEYLQQANEALVTIAQIETMEALENIEEIAKVPGIDVLFIGPFDLGNNIGHPILDGTMQPELKEAIAKIVRAAKENKKSTGIYATSGDQARLFADQGFNMVSVVADMVALPSYLTSALTTAKGSYVHSALNVAKGAVFGAAKMTQR
ncbi:MAG: hypothetical protein Q9187_003796, partial [Circinaria calcarea]